MLQECQDVLYKSRIFDAIFSLSNYFMFLTQQPENYLIMVSKLHKWGWNWVSQINESYIYSGILDSNLPYFYYSLWHKYLVSMFSIQEELVKKRCVAPFLSSGYYFSEGSKLLFKKAVSSEAR